MLNSRKLLFLVPVAIVMFGLLAFLPLSKNSTSESANDKAIWPTRQELRRNFWQSKKMLIVYATGDAKQVAAYDQSARQYMSAVSWLEVAAKPDTLASREDLTTRLVMLIGVNFKNRFITEMIAGLPVRFKNSGFSFGKAFESRSGDVFVLSLYPNPLNLSLPVSFIGSDDPANITTVLSNMRSFLRHSGEFRVFRDGQGVALGFFKQDENNPWHIDEKRTRLFESDTEAFLETSHYRLIFHGQSGRSLKEIGQVQDAKFASMLERIQPYFPQAMNLPPITYHLYQSPEDKGLITRNTDLSHYDSRRWAVHALLNDVLDGTDMFSEARLVTKKLAGESTSLALQDGLAMIFTKGWGKQGYRYWAKRFAETGNVNPLHELLDNKIYKRESYLFMRPQAGVFVDYLIERFGPENFLELHRNWRAKGLPAQMQAGITLTDLESGWHDYLNRLPEAATSTPGQSHRPVFQKGFCYAHEGYQIYNGYLSRKGFASLGKLRSLGSDWISITPFGYLDDRNKPGYFHFSFGSGSENDESVVTAMQQAEQLGMRSMLKPHVLMNSRNWGWPGEVEMKSEADWQAFFKYYNKWIRHYALLAELYDFDIFCIGTELLHTTKMHQKEWRAIIKNIKSLYSGPLTYAANWWQEFEQIEFWDELDYIGMNCYYPLSHQETATVEDLKKGVGTFMPILEAAAKKYKKPVLLTEIGFTSTAQSWKEPHDDGFSKSVYLEDQAKCYRAVFESFENKPWFYGFYWWKWPTYLERGGRRHSSFTPNGKPAENVVAEWYGKDWGLNR